MIEEYRYLLPPILSVPELPYMGTLANLFIVLSYTFLIMSLVKPDSFARCILTILTACLSIIILSAGNLHPSSLVIMAIILHAISSVLIIRKMKLKRKKTEPEGGLNS